MRKKEIIGALLFFAGIVGIAFVNYKNSKFDDKTRPFSSYTLLVSSWEQYKERFINDDGRVIDYSQNDITTSEGQSYAMLRSVFIDDKEIFDLVWEFTKNNLKRNDSNTFGWKWGQIEDEKWGFYPDGGENSASDADQDIALSLIFASRRWGDKTYEDEALNILGDLWDESTVELDGKRYFLAGNWADLPNELVLNPSYFAPYAWKVFTEVDKDHDWSSLIAPAYEVLEMSSSLPLDKETTVGLPPNWVSINKESGELIKPSEGDLDTDYSFDALRVPLRIAIDAEWNDEERAKDYLANFKFLKDEYEKEGKIYVGYSHDGAPLSNYENPAMYAASLGYFMIFHPDLAGEIYQDKIIDLYSNGISGFDPNIPYYEQNMLWFGMALYEGKFIKI